MGSGVFGLVLDIVVIAMLGVTIFYALRLSRHLETFRSNRADMQTLIRELGSQITKAQEGIGALDDMSRERGDELRRLVAKAQGLLDELHLMTESGDSLATRLEGLATKNRAMIDKLGQATTGAVYPGGKPDSFPPEPLAAPSKREERTPPRTSPRTPLGSSPFTIRDPDFTEGDADGNEARASRADIPSRRGEDFSSEAERDLADALRRWVPGKPK